MFNVISSNASLPNSIEIHTIARKNLIIRLRDLRKSYFELGWNILIIKNKLGFMAIDIENKETEPPLLEDCWKEESFTRKEKFLPFDSLENKNQLSHSLFSTLQYNTSKNLDQERFVIAKELDLHFKKDFLIKIPILNTNNYLVYEGLQFIPSLKEDEDKLFPLFIVKRVLRVKGIIKGSPRKLQDLAKISTVDYFKRLNFLLKEFIGNEIECVLGNHVFKIKGNTEEFSTKFFEITDDEIGFSSGEDEIYEEDDLYLEEIEEEEEYKEEDEIGIQEFLEEEVLKYVFPIIPRNIEYSIIKDPPLWIGRNEKKSNTTPMYLLNQFGPLKSPHYKIVFIPLYPNIQKNIKAKLEKVCNLIINGSGTGLFDFPGLKRRFGISVFMANSKSFPINLDHENFKREISTVLSDLRDVFPNFPLNFSINSEIVPIFMIGFNESAVKEWGKYTPLYQYFKENLTRLGFPSQIITKFNKFLVGKWISYPLWNLSTSLFAKIGGVPWHVDKGLTRKKEVINAIIGYRFARSYSKDENEYILGIATIFTGNGKYLGFKVGNIEIDQLSDKYHFFFRSHGYTRRYEGLKIPAKDVKNLFNDAMRYIEDIKLFQENPGGIVVHRLGSISNEEANSFLKCFQLSKFSAGALVSMSEYPLKWNFNNKTVDRGTWINLDETSGLLFPQGSIKYSTGYNIKNYFPASIPKSYKIRILRDTGVYDKVYEAGDDIIALSRMNWRHTTYMPSNYPISLEYSLIIAQNIKNNIIPSGDLIKLPWFL